MIETILPDAIELNKKTKSIKKCIDLTDALKHIENITGGIHQQHKQGKFHYNNYNCPSEKSVTNMIIEILTEKNYVVSIWDTENGPDYFHISWEKELR